MSGIGAIGASYNGSALYAMYRDRLSAGRSQAYYAADISAARAASIHPAQPEIPVEPVSPVRAVKPDAAVRIPVAVQEPRLPRVEDLDSAAETLSRMRIQYPEEIA